MRVKIAALADYATISQEKKLSILGIFSQINASDVPCAHPQMVIVVQFEFEPPEAGHEKHFGIELQDEDGRLITSITGTGIIPESKEAEPVVVNQAVTLRNIVFPEFGQYEFKILLDGEPVETLAFRVVRTTRQPGLQGV